MTSIKHCIIRSLSLFSSKKYSSYLNMTFYRYYFLRTLIYLCFQTGSLSTDLGIHTLSVNKTISKGFFFILNSINILFSFQPYAYLVKYLYVEPYQRTLWGPFVSALKCCRSSSHQARNRKWVIYNACINVKNHYISIVFHQILHNTVLNILHFF